MEQLVVAIFILGFIYLGHTTGQPMLNLASVGFIFYLAFTVGVPALMVILVILGLFQLLYMYNNIFG